MIAGAFPPLPGSVARSYTALGQAAAAGPGGEAELADLPRPWLPASYADPLLRAAIWTWCDQVVGWINEQYAGRPGQMIPGCWPAHPHLAQELPMLAFTCWTALQAAAPGPLEAWQRDTFSGFARG